MPIRILAKCSVCNKNIIILENLKIYDSAVQHSTCTQKKASYSAKALATIPGLADLDIEKRTTAIMEHAATLNENEVHPLELDIMTEIIQVECTGETKVKERRKKGDLVRDWFGLLHASIMARGGKAHPVLDKKILRFYEVALLEANNGMLWHDLAYDLKGSFSEIPGFPELIGKIYLRFEKLKHQAEKQSGLEAMMMRNNVHDPIYCTREALVKLSNANAVKAQRIAIKEAYKEIISDVYDDESKIFWDDSIAKFSYEFGHLNNIHEEFLAYLRSKDKSVRITLLKCFRDEDFVKALDEAKYMDDPSVLETLLMKSKKLRSHALKGNLCKYIQEKAKSL